MTQPADRIFTNAEVHTLDDPDSVHEAVAVRNGRIVRVDSAYEVEFLEGVDTDVVDCDGGVLLPGFIDAHTHMEVLGRRLVHADLGGTADRNEAVDRLGDAPTESGWILGYGYDESTWPDSEYLTRDDLDAVSTELPVVAFREDLHTASVNGVVLDRYGDEMGGGVERDGGEPTGVVREGAAEFLRKGTAPGREETKRLVEAARDYAHSLGVTGVHDMVRNSDAPAAYRELDRDDELGLRVRLYYWADHLDAVEELGLVTNHGSEFVRVGGIKTFTDGSIGARTAKLSEPYSDGDEGERSDGTTGEWVVTPTELEAIAGHVDELGMQLSVHAIGDEAIEMTLGALPEDPDSRHRIEHAELLADDLEGFDAVASMQPNFLRWAREDGLYEHRLGERRTRRSNRFSDVLEADVPLAFGSDCMPLNPLYGVQEAVTAPEPAQRLSVTDALRAYTAGAAYAAHEETELGTVEPGKRADFVVLEASPWGVERDEIASIDVMMTVVDGETVYRQ